MEVVTAVFDEILHVHRGRGPRCLQKLTVFSFKSNFQYTPYVAVPGSPRLQAGMRVRALLRVPGDWKSLVGWLDLQTGELAAPNPKWHLGNLLFLAVWLVVWLMMSSPVLPGGSLFPVQSLQVLLWLFMALLWAIFTRSEYKAWRQAKSDLVALQAMAREK